MRKGNKIVVVLIIFLVILLAAGGAFAYVYLATDLLKTEQELFFKYFSQITSEGEFVDENINLFEKKKKETPYENSGEITVNVDIPENLGISVDKVNDLSIRYSGKTDKVNKKVEQNIEIDYGNDVVFPLQYRQIDDVIGLQFEHFGSKFIAVRNEELKELAQKLGVEDVSAIPDKIEFTENNQKLEFSAEELEQLKQIYGVILKEQLSKENFSSIEAIGSVSYILKLSSEQVKNIIVRMLETSKENTLLIDKVNQYILSMTENNEESKFEEIDEDAIDKLIESINEEEFSNLKITLIQSDKKLNRILIESGNNKVEIEKNEDGDIIGYNIKLQISKEASDSNDQEDELISTDIKVNAYFNVEYVGLQTLDNVQNNYEIGFEIDSEDENLKYDYKINNNISFKEKVTIDEISKDKAVFLNDHKEEVITKFLGQVGQKLVEINKQQMKELGLEEIQNPLLYSNPITTLGIMIYNMASKTVEDATTNLQQMEIDSFNAKFTSYEGIITGSTCKMLLKIIENNNLESTEMKVKVTLDGTEISESDNIDTSKNYLVEAIYDDLGYITEMKITTND